LTPDYTVPDVRVASGMAKLKAQNVDNRAHGSTVTTWPEVTVTVLVKAATLALTDNDVNDIYIDVGLTSGPDDVSLIAVDSNGSAPAEPALKIAEVDTSADTATPINEHPDAVVGTLDAETVNVSGTMDASVVSAGDGLTVQDADLDVDWYSPSEGGVIAAGDAGPVWVTTLANNEELFVTQASLVMNDDTSPPTDLDLVIADPSEGSAKTTIIAGDGTDKNDETGAPLASYQNTTGSSEDIGVFIDNGNFGSGTGSEQQAIGSFIGRVA